MEIDEAVLERALRTAERFLDRWTDPTTRNLRDDLAQEAVVVLWRRSAALRRPSGVGGFVRTVTRRLRFRAVERRAILDRSNARERSEERSTRVLSGEPPPERIRIGDLWVCKHSALAELGDVLSRLPPLNALLLREYYSGRSCAELGRRFELPAWNVKARIHRSRRRIRLLFEGRARALALF